MDKELLNGDDLASRLGLTWSHAVVYGDVDDVQIFPDLGKKHFEFVVPLGVSDETNYLSLTEKMVRAKMVETVSPLMAIMMIDPAKNFDDPQVHMKVTQLQQAQRWTELWVTDKMRDWLGEKEVKSNLVQTVYMFSELTPKVLARFPGKDVSLEFALLAASIQRMGLTEDETIQPLLKTADRFLETVLGKEGVEVVHTLAGQLAEQIPALPENSKEALQEYEQITQAMLPVVGASFTAHLMDHQGHQVWKIEE